MTNEICKRELCTGCAACFSGCPTNSIIMREDDEGFLRPIIDSDTCIECKKCIRNCPINNAKSDDGVILRTLAIRIKDREILEKSSSGGVFTALAQEILKNGGAVIGAGFDDDFSVKHKICKDEKSIDEIRRSKYVQSKIGTVYIDALGLLNDGKKILFCGTPCQIAGFKAFLRKDYSNLYTVDFICHGIPSPAIWQKYLSFREEEADSPISKITFRSKNTGWKNSSLKINFADGNEYNGRVSDDLYLRSFIMNMDLRPSCYHCQFRQIHRVSDITIADFWGAENYCSSWDDDKGISLAFVHTQKGKQLLSLCSANIETINIEFKGAIASNPSMTISVKEPPLRGAFMADAQRLPFDKLHDQYCGNGIKAKLRRKIADLSAR